MDELNLVDWGPAYNRRPAIGKNKNRRSNPGELGEAVRLLKKARPHLKDTRRGDAVREQIEDFLDRIR